MSNMARLSYRLVDLDDAPNVRSGRIEITDRLQAESFQIVDRQVDKNFSTGDDVVRHSINQAHDDSNG